MSPAKRPVAKLHTRSEIVVAVVVGVGIVLATLLLIWAMRPGEPGVPGTGGILSRQPRVAVLVVLALAALWFGLWWVRNGQRRPKRLSTKAASIIVVAVVLVGSVVAGIFWPGGLVKHYQSFPDIEDLDDLDEPAPDPSTDSTEPGSTDTTTTPESTTADSTTPGTTEATTTPTSGG